MTNKVIVIGAGFTGMALAAQLASKGFEVEIFEKNDLPGGRARNFSAEGFTFNMGPVWLSFPEIIESFFQDFNVSTAELFQFEQLEPSFRVFFKDQEYIDIPSDQAGIGELFKKYDKAGDKKITEYLNYAEKKYQQLLQQIKGRIDSSLNEKIHHRYFKKKHSRYIRKLFKDFHLLTMLEFPISFPGIFPVDNSTISYINNFSLLKHGIQSPKGGITKIVGSMTNLLESLNVTIHLSTPVEGFDIIGDKVAGIITQGKNFHADYFVAATDYHYAEHLLPKESRNYSDSMWEKCGKTPSALIFYLGIDKNLENFQPNSVYFNNPSVSKRNFRDISEDTHDIPALFFTVPSKIDKHTSDGRETLILRVIVPPGIEDIGKMREHFFEKAISIIETITNESILEHIVMKKTYTQTDFTLDYNTYRGNAFGFLPNLFLHGNKDLKIQNQHLKNLFYGEFPVFMGTGIPSALLSGKVVAGELYKEYKKHHS